MSTAVDAKDAIARCLALVSELAATPCIYERTLRGRTCRSIAPDALCPYCRARQALIDRAVVVPRLNLADNQYGARPPQP